MKLSIVTTLYRSSATIEDFCRRALKSAQAIFSEVELVIVNDGSPDKSLELALGLHQHDSRIVVVDLSRNFGHYKAMMTGLSYATGELVFLIDSDLEERPEDLTLFYQRLMRGDSDVVYGVQQTRRGGVVERVGGAVFFALVDALGDRPLPRNLVTARLMTCDYVRALVRHRDREFVISDLWQITGFRQNEIVVEKLSTSPSTYSVWKRVDLALKHLTTASTRLLYLVFYTGLLIFMASIGIVGFFLLRYVTAGIGVSGFTSLIISIWFLGGLTTLILGILGIYMASILSETKRRPYTVVRRVHRASPAAIGRPEPLLMESATSVSADVSR
ncbi:glycosyltransferase family 2 protein [Bradyrhizobium lablabi]|uniref:glycosyltransferase family 2 protein n=1 Tax=Bradyrhizobium lablabi TaxID=722472 RepID=UPI00090BD82F|nr:glycosyltransferase family 2 protein [Bradyrhizobium lablabi]SHM81325.1 putative glycosyltransferase [Bradyrhizobium lablabi]